MVHASVLASAPYALLSVAALATAVLFAVAVLLRLRRVHMLIGVAAFALLAIWFGLLSISAGPSPMLVRGQVADMLRWLAVAVAVVWFGWLALYAWSVIRIER